MSDYPNEAAKQACVIAAKAALDDARSLLEASGIVPKTEYAIPFWALAFHSNGTGAHGKRWYHVVRAIEADGKTWELYWHPDTRLRGRSMVAMQQAANELGVKLAKGIYHDAPRPCYGSELVRVS